MKWAGQGDGGFFRHACLTTSRPAERIRELERAWRFRAHSPGIELMFRRAAVPPVKVAEPEVVDFRLDVLVVRGMDGFAQFLDQELYELGAGPLQVLPERLRTHGLPGFPSQAVDDVVDGGLGMVPSQLEHAGVAILGGRGLVSLEP